MTAPDTPGPARTRGDSYAGTGELTRFYLRRSLSAITLWVLGTAAMYPIQSLSLKAAPTQEDLDRLAAGLSGNSAIKALTGPDFALNTIGGQIAWQSSAFGAVLAGLMSTFLVARHGRAGEENGADELILAGVVGRSAPTAATALVTAGANIAVIVIAGASLTATGLPATGSWTLAAAGGLTGLVFGALALIFAQISSTSRGVWGLSGAALGVAYALRAAGDVGDNGIRWLSPIGWGQQARAYAGERVWPLVLLVVAAGVAVAVAGILHRRRDFGAGLLPQRRGPASHAWAGGIHELSWRLAAPGIIGWTAGLVFCGVKFGLIGNSIEAVVRENKDVAGTLTGGQAEGVALVDGFYGSAVLMLAIIASGFAVMLASRARSAEVADYAESLLATALGRSAYLTGPVVTALVAPVLAVAAGGAAAGLTYAVVSGEAGRGLQLAAAGIFYAPSIWVIVAVTVLLMGVAPKLIGLAWVPVGFSAIAIFFGPALKFPQWLLDLSPFTHLALVPLEDVSWLPPAVLTIVAVALVVLGLVAFGRRDIG